MNISNEAIGQLARVIRGQSIDVRLDFMIKVIGRIVDRTIPGPGKIILDETLLLLKDLNNERNKNDQTDGR